MRSRVAVAAPLLLTALLLAGCTRAEGNASARADRLQVDTTGSPQLGACRVLGAEDVAQPSNATPTVDCGRPHTAETFDVGTLPGALSGVSYDSDRLGSFVRRTCGDRFRSFVGADDSLVLRSVVTWVWFRPSREAWDQGARWYRCDVVGGGPHSTAYVDLPATARGLLADDPVPDRWLACVDGGSVQTAPPVPCTRPHTWRAVTAVRVGDPDDPYPGDRAVQAKSRAYCTDYVGAWLGYPASYDFGFTWFHEAEWRDGNRRSVCWARTAA